MLVAVSGLRLRLIVDNALVGTATLTGIVLDDPAVTPVVTIGFRAPGVHYFRGQLESVHLYHRALSYIEASVPA